MSQPPGWIQRIQASIDAHKGAPRLVSHVAVGVIDTHTLKPPPPPLGVASPPPPTIPPAATPTRTDGRNPDGTWPKGFAPNPTGKQPKRTMALGELRKKARELTAEAIQTLEDAMKYGEDWKTRIVAANALLDRGYGKAMQPVEVGGPGAFENMTDADLDRYIDDRAKMVLGLLAPPADDV